MTMTDLERDLRATLIEAGEHAPVVENLFVRASRPVRRRRQAWWVAGLATAATAAASVMITVVVPGGQDVANPAAGPSTPTPALSEALLGTWTPVDVPLFGGRTPGASTLPAGRVTDIAFQRDRSWHGSDGCNGVGGKYRAGDDGSFSASVGPQTMMGCWNVMHSEVLDQAARFGIDGRTLSFYAKDGRLLGTYARV